MPVPINCRLEFSDTWNGARATSSPRSSIAYTRKPPCPRCSHQGSSHAGDWNGVASGQARQSLSHAAAISVNSAGVVIKKLLVKRKILLRHLRDAEALARRFAAERQVERRRGVNRFGHF